MLRDPVADPMPAAREHATARAPVRPTTPTILFENMTKGGRESYAKSLLIRQKEAKAPKQIYKAEGREEEGGVRHGCMPPTQADWVGRAHK